MVGRPFQPGQSGNPAGRPKSKPFKNALQEALKAAGDNDEMLRTVALALVTKAKDGDVPAIKEIADRLDGKVPQAVIGGEDDDPAVKMLHRIERVIVSPSNQDG